MASIILTSRLGEPSSWQKISFHMLVELGFLREYSISALLPWWFPWTMHVDSASSNLGKCEGLQSNGLVAWQVSFATLFGLSSVICFGYIVLLFWKFWRSIHPTEVSLDLIRARDDLIHTELRKVEVPKAQEIDQDLPGLGQYYCLHCE